MALTRMGKAVVGAFAVSGVIHLVRPQVFEPIIPEPLREHSRDLVYASGVAELVCAAGMLVPKLRPVARFASAGLLVAVFPANMQMAMDAGAEAERDPSPRNRAIQVVTLARLPLQWPMIRGVLKSR